MLSQGLKACVGKDCDLKESQCGLLKWSCRRHRRSEDSFGTYLGACPKKLELRGHGGGYFLDELSRGPEE